MMRPSRWVVVPAAAALTLAASIITASARAPQGAAPAPAQETATQKANREATGKAPRGPFAYSGASGYTNYLGGGVGRSPEQPIKFPHPVHVNTLKLNCVYCHFSAFKSPDPGLPAVGTCLGCHAGPGMASLAAQRPELKKLLDYGAKNEPIPWVRIHKVPEYVHFPHMRHVNAGVTCQSCHGQINNMPQVFQYASLNMGWCVSCHVQGYSPAEGLRAAGYVPDSAAIAAPRKRATYDCSNCHY
ncbi:MAG TPA: cytochrome c3 family protein [Gemmatimonadaceae bacterium]|nr:cytochrome c3 family protein [Gemmatimonadaceae bacterium]